MARKLLPGHLPLDDDTLDRFSVGPDKKLYIDDEKLVTQDLFEAFKTAGWKLKVGAFIVGLTGVLLALASVSNQVLEWNDRYCWEPRFYSLASKCAGVDKAADAVPVAPRP